jgi:energy-coupling factor transporter ATP-binding protein EcfA2
MIDSRLPDTILCADGATWKTAELSRAMLQSYPRDAVRELAKAVHKHRGTSLPSLTWIGQRATVDQLIALILGDFVEQVSVNEPQPVQVDESGAWTPTMNKPFPDLNPKPVDDMERVLGNNGQHDIVSDLRDVLGRLGIASKTEVNMESVQAYVDDRLHGSIGELCQAIDTLRTESAVDVANRFMEEKAKLLALVQEALANVQTKRIEVALPSGEVNKVDCAHEKFEECLAYLICRKNVYLVGPSGSGKSEMLKQAAQALSLEYDDISCCQQTPSSAFLGFMNANGGYVETAFRRRYENGGVFNADELDKMNANIAAVLNSGTSGKGMSFPDRYVTKHADFIFAGTANTWGKGADRNYVGSVQLDAATLDRFAFVPVDYDESFERRLAGNDEWVDKIQHYRANAVKNNIRIVISPRASIDGARLLASGKLSAEQVENALLFRGCDALTVQKIKGLSVSEEVA